jgi:SAM-dependent methyltransferase
MFRATLAYLRCPKVRGKNGICAGTLSLPGASPDEDVRYGTLTCEACGAEFPILEGVAIVVPEVQDYLLLHVKGLSKLIPDEQIPKQYRREYLAYRAEIEEEHIEEDLESERVNSLYLMNHYLSVKGASGGSGDATSEKWWKGSPSSESPEITDLIERYWDQGPMEVISTWIPDESKVMELGCGVGGLYRRLPEKTQFYLGVDSSFFSILLARHLNFGGQFSAKLRHPKDLFQGNASTEFKIDRPLNRIAGDFVVGEMDQIPLRDGAFDGSVSLNAMDMLDDPEALPKAQFKAVHGLGFAIQSGPYIWHERISKALRKQAPKAITDSASMVEWLFQKNGFQIKKSKAHIPWLFFKHLRQIELYSVHAFLARKQG